MSIMDDMKKLFNPDQGESESETEGYAVPVIPVSEPSKPEPLKTDDGKIRFFFPMLQTDNPDSWAAEIGIKDKNIAWNMCMTTSFTMMLYSLIKSQKLEFLYPLDEKSIEKWYYQEFMMYLATTPEPDHRWQAGAHARFINRLLALNNRLELKIKTGTSSPSELKKQIDSGLPYVFGTWTTNAGHIVCAVGYNDQGAFICDPYGNWKLGYPAQNRSAGPHLYSWADIDFLMGINAHGLSLPPGYGRTWSAFCEVIK